MLWILFVMLMFLWILGVISSYALGGFIDNLLLVAIAVVLVRIIQSRKVVE